jgi:ribosome-binding protein aMBF1 (putative translation factor)
MDRDAHDGAESGIREVDTLLDTLAHAIATAPEVDALCDAIAHVLESALTKTTAKKGKEKVKSTRNTAYDTAHMRSTHALQDSAQVLSLGERIRLEREARNWSQGHTAMLAGITRMYLAKLEVGDRKDVPSAVLARLADAFETSMDSLIGRRLDVM